MNEQKISNFATIGEIFEDGVSLIFDGQDAATEKHYKANTSIVFKAGDRVKILADSGTYVVEYVVGTPKSDNESEENIVGIPPGGSYGYFLRKKSANDYDVEWRSYTAPTPTAISDSRLSGTTIQFGTDSAGAFYIRKGTSGTWKKITVT